MDEFIYCDECCCDVKSSDLDPNLGPNVCPFCQAPFPEFKDYTDADRDPGQPTLQDILEPYAEVQALWQYETLLRKAARWDFVEKNADADMTENYYIQNIAYSNEGFKKAVELAMEKEEANEA